MVKNLKLLRNKKGISQQQLADVIGISQQSVNKYENHNVEPDNNILIEFANYFNTSVDFLIGHTNIEHIIEKVEAFELNKDEANLINKYRTLNNSEKQSIKLVIDNYVNK